MPEELPRRLPGLIKALYHPEHQRDNRYDISYQNPLDSGCRQAILDLRHSEVRGIVADSIREILQRLDKGDELVGGKGYDECHFDGGGEEDVPEDCVEVLSAPGVEDLPAGEEDVGEEDDVDDEGRVLDKGGWVVSSHAVLLSDEVDYYHEKKEGGEETGSFHDLDVG